jgi:excisionase family DNA binding protein
MSDIEKLALLADKAEALLRMNDEIEYLRAEVARLHKPRVLSTKEAAEILRVSHVTVVSWINKGLIPAIMSRNGYRIPEDKIFAYAERDAERRRKNA